MIGITGVKMFGLIPMLKDIRNYKQASLIRLFLIVSFVLAFLGMYLFTLNTNYPRATMSFHLIFIAVLAIFFSEQFVKFLDKKNVSIKVIAVMLMVLLGLGSTSFTLLAFAPKYLKYKRLSENELTAIDFIKNNTAQDAAIVHNRPEAGWFSYDGKVLSEVGYPGRDCFISAFTARRVVAECSWHVQIGNYAPDIISRQQQIDLLFTTRDKDRAMDILQRYKVNYIWAQGTQDIKFDKGSFIKKVFSQGNIKIYKVT